jgi:hypothetical protein
MLYPAHREHSWTYRWRSPATPRTRAKRKAGDPFDGGRLRPYATPSHSDRQSYRGLALKTRYRIRGLFRIDRKDGASIVRDQTAGTLKGESEGSAWGIGAGPSTITAGAVGGGHQSATGPDSVFLPY